MFCLRIGWFFKVTDVLFVNKSSLWGDWRGACKQIMRRLHESTLQCDWWFSSLIWLMSQLIKVIDIYERVELKVTDVPFSNDSALWCDWCVICVWAVSNVTDKPTLWDDWHTTNERVNTLRWLLFYFLTNHLFDVTNESLASESIAWLSSLMW